ncbi:alpha/beta hydrolase [Erythrobacter aureus]|uniref:Alpha/beta hydrolase n=1 Tax=Erythrobacter aureus TaxID=2182384 RepID=A0A345YBJ5_9SPHN|nr:alpha/beta hydrolase-fold protein [Erythrobacter aureus]AXK41297.1 alpha/beta hydrolase [Erythrobacter aureus]
MIKPSTIPEKQATSRSGLTALCLSFLLVLEGCAGTLRPASTAIAIGQSHQLYSSHFEEHREINVWLPPGYADSNVQYNAVYLIDGGREQDFHHISGLAQLGVLNGTIEPLIIIGIRTDNRAFELTETAADPRYVRPADRAGGAPKFRRYIADEVIPFVEANYRVGARKAVLGESLAGLFILETFFSQPELFTDYIAISPSLWYDDRALSRASASRMPESMPGSTLFLAMADEGGTMQTGMDEIVAALNAGQPAGLTWMYSDRRETEHHWTIYHNAAHDALKWAFGLPAPDYDLSSEWYMQEGGSPPSE